MHTQFRPAPRVVHKYFIYFWQKKWSFVVFILFVATLSDFGLLFLLIEALIELNNFFLKEKIIRCTALKLPNP